MPRSLRRGEGIRGHAGCVRIRVRSAMQTVGSTLRGDLAVLLAIAAIVLCFLVA